MENEEVLNKYFKEWCKETKRNGGVLMGVSIKEFFSWLSNKIAIIVINEQ